MRREHAERVRTWPQLEALHATLLRDNSVVDLSKDVGEKNKKQERLFSTASYLEKYEIFLTLHKICACSSNPQTSEVYRQAMGKILPEVVDLVLWNLGIPRSASLTKIQFCAFACTASHARLTVSR